MRQNHNTLTVSFEKFKTDYFVSTIKKNIDGSFSRFSLKLICFLAFETTSSFFLFN